MLRKLLNQSTLGRPRRPQFGSHMALNGINTVRNNLNRLPLTLSHRPRQSWRTRKRRTATRTPG